MYTDISKLRGIISVILLSRFLCYLLILFDLATTFGFIVAGGGGGSERIFSC